MDENQKNQNPNVSPFANVPLDPLEVWIAAENVGGVCGRLFIHGMAVRMNKESDYDDRRLLNADSKTARKHGYLVVAAARRMGLDASALMRILSDDRLWEYPNMKEDGCIHTSALRLCRRVAEEARVWCSEAGIDIDALLEESQQQPLTEVQETLIGAMLELGAFSADSRKSTSDIVAKAFGREALPDSYKKPMSLLGKMGLVSAGEGRGSGCWLTLNGRKRAEKMK